MVLLLAGGADAFSNHRANCRASPTGWLQRRSMQPGDIAVHIGGGVSATGHCWILLKKEREEDGTAL